MSELVQRFARIVVDQPDRPAVYISGKGEMLTVSELWRMHATLRMQMSAMGIGPNCLVVSATGNRPAAVPLLLACLALGAPLAPVDADATPSEIAGFAARLGAAAIVLPQSAIHAFGVAGQSVPLTADLHVAMQPKPRDAYRGAALLKLTSGSSGFPKATLTAESQLIADGQQILDTMGIAAADTQMAAIPISHSYGMSNLVMPLLLQGTPFVLRDSFIPQQLLLDARNFKARVFPGVPYMFNYFAANAPADGWPAGLELLISAGARQLTQTVETFHERFGKKIHSFYGASETGGIAYDAGAATAADGQVGLPMRGVTIAVRDDDEAPQGSGRIFVRSASVALGYLEADEVESPFTDGGFVTEDYGFVDAGGALVLTGRASRAINVAGRKVQPAEIERVLHSMEGVEEARVVAIPDARRGQQIVACVVGRRDATVMEVRRFCAARLAAHKVPRVVIFLPALPLTLRGKIDHGALTALAAQRLEVKR